MSFERFTSSLTLVGAIATSACSGSSEATKPAGTGAAPASTSANPSGSGGQGNPEGGTESQGGSSAQNGGTAQQSNTGTTIVGSGGSSAAAETGGAVNSGGSIAALGGSANGGSATTTVGKGGTVAAGGNASTGGNATAGSKATAGGSTAAGGKSTGGNAATGGNTPTGGTNTTAGGGNAGSCVESTCGSHKWPCWRMPTPVSEKLPNAQSYTDLGNGAVRDNITCLVWEKANSDVAGSWQATADRCATLASSNFAGFGDWRLPTRVEMASITDVTLGSKGYPAIFTTTSGYYSTKSYWYKTILSPSNTNRVWGYGTNGFTSNAIVIADTNKVARCVRGNGTGEAYNAYAVEPPNHYTVTGTGTDATVKDNYTGLIWQQTYSTARMAWSEAASYCAAQNTGGLSGWRVPTLTELASTVNEALVAPAINRTVFPNTNGSCDPDGWFWAAEASKVGGTAWGLSYCDGYTGWNAATNSADWNYFVDGWVRCVHN